MSNVEPTTDPAAEPAVEDWTTRPDDPAGDAASGSAPVEPNAEKDPDEWVTGDEPSTGAQRSYLETLAQEAGTDVDPSKLTKAEASQMIDRLQEETGRHGDS